jgi:hypothetical protein
MRLSSDGLQLIQCHALPLEDGERPEGLAFLTSSRLAVVTEGPARLITFRVTRRAATRV